MVYRRRTSKANTAILSALLSQAEISPGVLKLLLILLLLGDLRFRSAFDIVESPEIKKQPLPTVVLRSEEFSVKKPRERFL
jgi:hypothetical protein